MEESRALRCVDRTSEFRELVRKQRARLGEPTPQNELLRPNPKRSAFESNSLETMKQIHTMADFLRENHTAYLLDDGLYGMSDAERDEIDAETQRFLRACGERIDRLKQLATVVGTGEEDDEGSGDSPPTPSVQLTAHRQAALQILYDRLRCVTAVADEHRGHRLQRATEARDQRVGSAARAAGSLERASAGAGASGVLGSALTAGSALSATIGAGIGAASALGGGLGGLGGPEAAGGGGAEAERGTSEVEWAEHEVVEDDSLGLDAGEVAQLQLENKALHERLSTLVEQAREAESSVLEISNLNHLFASKVEQQGAEVEMLYANAEQTAENLVRGNAYIDSASKHSRDFRLAVLTFLLVASFGLLFLDYYYE